MMKENTFSSKEVGHFIYKRRKELHYTQKDLADMLYVTDRAVSKWERGISVPDIATLLQLSRILKVDVDVILNGGNHSTVSNSAMGWQYYLVQLPDQLIAPFPYLPTLHKKSSCTALPLPESLMNRINLTHSSSHASYL